MILRRLHPAMAAYVRELQEKQRFDVEALKMHDDDKDVERFSYPGADVAHAWVRRELVREIRARGRHIDVVIIGHVLAAALRAPS